MTRIRYLTDLSDQEWIAVKPFLPEVKAGGTPPIHSRREILNGIFYIVRSGCAWRLLPRDLPSWKTVYHYFRIWRKDGTWERLHTAIRQQLRVKLGREARAQCWCY